MAAPNRPTAVLSISRLSIEHEVETGGPARESYISAAICGGTSLAKVSEMPAPGEQLVGVGDNSAAVDLDPAESARIDVSFHVNERHVRLAIDPRVTLLDVLREHLGLTGSKKGCDHGQCGACTVHIDGRRVLSCLTLAAMIDGRAVTTIEGLGGPEKLHAVQQAFIDHDAFQCGYCTPGQIMSAVALLAEPCGPTDDDVRECLSGNLCRCGAYPGIVKAVQAVRGTQS